MENAVVWTGVQVTGHPGFTVTDAIAFTGDRVIALGSAATKLAADEVIDAGGGFICHGFGDGHVHSIFGGLEPQFAPVRGHADPQAIARAVGDWARDHPEADWIRGEGFDHTLAPGGVFYASWLDAEVPDRPVALRATDYHTVWVNSAALRLAGYANGVTQPHDGEIVCDESGEPTGTLREWGAWRPVYDLMPALPSGMRMAALEHAAQAFRSSGLTWVQDAWVERKDVDTWLEAAEQGILTFRADLALWADPNRWNSQLEGFETDRARVAAAGFAGLSATTVKFFADGVIESGTGALLEPYCDCPHSRGMPNWDPEQLKAAVTAIDAMGFNTHIHAIGDAAARMALDAIEAAIIANGPRDRRPVIVHLQLVDEADLERFAALGIVANFEPYWAKFDSWQTELTAPRLGDDRTRQQYRINTIMQTGATVSFGSDWPVTTYAPLAGIQVAVNRRMSADPADAPWLPEECITVEQALAAYTSGVGRQTAQDDDGVIRPGGRADLVWLASDPRAVDPMAIEDIAVLGTWSSGRRVHGG
ncbi:MAG: amidohydrolase family protein [Actinobacteria bacterium]|nr:amidohydrolase family protein [Actinomycetota bacterium]